MSTFLSVFEINQFLCDPRVLQWTLICKSLVDSDHYREKQPNLLKQKL